MENGQIIKDDNVPFVENDRGSDKTCQWTNDGICIPDYYACFLGAGSEFIANESVPALLKQCNKSK